MRTSTWWMLAGLLLSSAAQAACPPEGTDPASLQVLREQKFAVPDDVRDHQARVDAADVLTLIFPIYWWSFPAILKGWIDRVWNRGWAYGPRKLGLRKGLMIGLQVRNRAAEVRNDEF